LRIVHLINSLATGGAENLVVNMAAAMRDQGHDVRIVTLGPNDGVPLVRAQGLRLNVRSVGRSPRDLTSLFRLRSEVRDADIVHVHLFPSLYLGALWRSGSLVYTEHSTSNRRRGSRVFRLLDRVVYRRYDSVVAISEGVRSELSSHFGQISVERPIDLVPNGIGQEFFEGSPRRERRESSHLRLIAVGTLDDRKNFAVAVEAMALLPGLELDIVGDGPLRSDLERQIDRLGIGDRVRLLGRRSDVRDVLCEHDALLSTSRFEGFSLVAAEALALGLPVIGPDVPGFSDSVLDDETGLLFDPSSRGDRSLVATVRRLQADPALYERLSARAVIDAERFRISSTVERYLSLYMQVRAAL